MMRPLLRPLPLASLGLLLLTAAGCVVLDGPQDPGPVDTTGPVDPDPGSAASLDSAGGSTDAGATGENPTDAPAFDLLDRLPGLWVAPVTSMTSAGDFPIMAMDIRPANDRTLFSRVDLDADNNLRFAFAVEEHDGEPTLVFRNGGYFLGILRDTRTALVEHDPAAHTWRFCAMVGGCGYVDARFDLSAPDQLRLATRVMGGAHMAWEGVRREPRDLDGDFPYDPRPGGADDPFPAMPSLRVTLSWTEPQAEAVDAWVIVSTTECGLVPGSCHPSRYRRARAAAGATTLELVVDQIHPGDYFANAVLDVNGNLAGTLLPDAGDLISPPNAALSVAALGESTASLALVVPL